MDDFERIEEQRERNEGFAYDEYRERMRAPVEADESGYDISDPKHPDHHDVYADVWDAREGK